MMLTSLLLPAFVLVAWFGLKWIFGWEPGIGLLFASVVVAAVAYGGLEALVVRIREGRDSKP